VQRDIVAQILYMRFMFSDAFTEIRKSQELLIDIYRSVLNRNIKDTKGLLNHFAPPVMKTGIYSARHYLSLGYRETTSASVHMLMADNYREVLFSMRLYEYVAAIKKSLQGKRYAFYAILESSYPKHDVSMLDRMDYNELHKMVIARAPAAAGTVPEDKASELLGRINSLEELELSLDFYRRRKRKDMTDTLSVRIDTLKKEIEDLDREYLAAHKEYGEKREFYALQHSDGYYKTIKGQSLYDSIWENPALDEIKEYREYLKKQ
jgi:hypothetical protein